MLRTVNAIISSSSLALLILPYYYKRRTRSISVSFSPQVSTAVLAGRDSLGIILQQEASRCCCSSAYAQQIGRSTSYGGTAAAAARSLCVYVKSVRHACIVRVQLVRDLSNVQAVYSQTSCILEQVQFTSLYIYVPALCACSQLFYITSLASLYTATATASLLSALGQSQICLAAVYQQCCRRVEKLVAQVYALILCVAGLVMHSRRSVLFQRVTATSSLNCQS